MEDKQLALFDYGTLDLDTRSFVQTKTAEIRILVKQTAQGIIEIGQRLIEVKERLKYQGSGFDGWLQLEFDWSRSTAYNFMNVASKCPTVGHLDFSPKVLYLLASPSAPEEARQEALTLAESGEKITHAKAQELVAKYKAEAEAAKQEKQQAIVSLEDRITNLEHERSAIAKERDQARHYKSADDQLIIRQDTMIEKLNQQIAELKAQVVQPQTIEKEVRVEVEKRVEVIPEDYDVLKVDVTGMGNFSHHTRQQRSALTYGAAILPTTTQASGKLSLHNPYRGEKCLPMWNGEKIPLTYLRKTVYDMTVLIHNIYKERQNKMEEILTTEEATKYLKITKRTLFKLVKEGKVRAMKVGNAFRFKKADLEEDLMINGNEPKAATR